MRYPQGGGLTAERQQFREELRLQAAERFARREGSTVIGRRFHLTYTIQGVRKLLVRNGWSCQVPARRAMERDDDPVAVWVKEVWP
uniref:helix-turn-helix domain-containing protein n=1 Tax=Streptomyces sanglieri TaxID=193460 RepID=UPI0035245E5A